MNKVSPEKTKVRVAAIVLNTVSHDVRVLKEAASLAKAGYEVRIFGINTPKGEFKPEETIDGFTISRVNWAAARSRTRFKLIGIIGSALLVAGLLFLTALFWPKAMSSDLLLVKYFMVAQLIGLLLGIAFLMRGRLMTLLRDRVPVAAKYAVSFKHWVLNLVRKEAFTDVVVSFKPDIIHCHDLHTLSLGYHLKRKIRGSKLIFDSHEIYEEMAGRDPIEAEYFKAVQARLSSKLDGFVTVNESIGRVLKERYPKFPEPIIVMNATPRDTQIANAEKDYRIHDLCGLSRDTKILLYQGGFAPHRGLEQAVRSVQFFPANWVLVFMGWGRAEDELRSIAKDLGLMNKKVFFVDKVAQKDLAAWTKEADIGLIPYENVCLNHYYCSPNKLWEYPRSGVPIIASDLPEMAKIINKYQIGWLVSDPMTKTAISDILKSLDDIEYVKKVDNCKQFIAVNNWETYGERLQNLYVDL